MDKKELEILEKYGFDTSPDRSSTINRHNRIIMSVRAHDKVGKTTFGLSAPKPIMYLNFDRKIEQSALDAIGVKWEDLFIKEIRTDSNLSQMEHQKQWQTVQDAFFWALRESRIIKSIVADTETNMWELARMAEFGKVDKVPPNKYTHLNAQYKFMLDQADKYNVNVILLQKYKKQYVKTTSKSGYDIATWNGKYEPGGFGQVKDIVQVNAEMYMEDGEPTLEIINNGLKASMNHEKFPGVMCSFPYVASMLTDTDVEEWE